MPLIAYDHHAFCLQSVGGVSRYFCELASRVERLEGHATRVIAPLHYNQHLRAAPGLSVLGCHWALRHPSMWRIYRAANAIVTPAVLAALRPSLLHTTYYWGVPRAFARPVVVTVFDMIHELHPDSFRADDPTRDAKRRVVERADHVICISHSTARDLARLLGVAESKITVTHLGFADTLSSVAAPPLSNARPYLLYVGQRHGYKNFAAMLEAWSSSERLRRDFDILAFGAGAFTADEQALLARLSPRADAVRQQAGSDAELARAYRGARAFVYPSAYEGFGIPPLEAMSVDCPVACSVASSLPEVVGDAALGFDPADREAMRDAMQRVAYDDDLRTMLITRGRQRVRMFSWERCATATAAVYRRLLG